jgi:hypothetical protein
LTDFSSAWVARLVRAFDESGVHRAATSGDYASGEWLCSEAQSTGARVSRSEMDLPRIEIDEAYIEWGMRRVDGLPLFDSAPVDGITGRLCPCGSGHEVGYLELPPNAASIKGMQLERIRRETGHRALVVATRVAGESLAPINAQFFAEPFGPPVLLVAGMHHEALAAHARQGGLVRLVSRYRREPARSYNVVARVAPEHGSAARRTGAPPPLPLLTPRTGWWESTAERAGGLVAWLAALHAAAALRRSRRLGHDVHAFATCGHELGHVGLQALLSEHAALVRDAPLWLHLGANLGCASNEQMMLRASDIADAERMRALLVECDYPAELIRIEPIGAVSGEGRDLVAHGARVLSLAGSNAHFHAASDRWPANVSAANVAAIARAVARWVDERAAM